MTETSTDQVAAPSPDSPVDGLVDAPPVQTSHERTFSRRHALKAFTMGGVTVLVAGTGALSYRAFDTGVLKPGTGPASEGWLDWRTAPGPLGAVGAATLIAAALWPNPQRWALLGLIAIGTVPFAVLAWTALVPVLVVLVTAAVAAPLLRQTGPAGRPA